MDALQNLEGQLHRPRGRDPKSASHLTVPRAGFQLPVREQLLQTPGQAATLFFREEGTNIATAPLAFQAESARVQTM